jgi:hypothetical protein
VNNFDLDQLEISSDYVDSGVFVEVVEENDYSYICMADCEPVYNKDVSLRFQINRRAVNSAKVLSRFVFSRHGAAPASMCDPRNDGYVLLGSAEVITRYVPRTTAAVVKQNRMTLDQAKRIASTFSELYSSIEKMPMYFSGHEGEHFGQHYAVKASYDYIEYCWFEPFYRAVKSLCKAERRKARQK